MAVLGTCIAVFASIIAVLNTIIAVKCFGDSLVYLAGKVLLHTICFAITDDRGGHDG